MSPPAVASPLPYFGSKMTMASFIAAMLPPHVHYVEPFAGSLAVLFAKRPSRMETVNDIDGAIVNFWRVLRDRPDDLMRACALTPHSLAEYQLSAMHDDPGLDDVERARRVWTRLTQARSAQLVPTGWRYGIAEKGTNLPSEMLRYLLRMPAAYARLRSVTIQCRPALDLICNYGAQPDVLLYVDPPYLGDSRVGGTNYRHEMRDPAQHRELAAALHACASAVVLSGYPSSLYDTELYPDWYRVTYDTDTAQGGVSVPRTEVLWSNRPLADAIQPHLDIDPSS